MTPVERTPARRTRTAQWPSWTDQYYLLNDEPDPLLTVEPRRCGQLTRTPDGDPSIDSYCVVLVLDRPDGQADPDYWRTQLLLVLLLIWLTDPVGIDGLIIIIDWPRPIDCWPIVIIDYCYWTVVIVDPVVSQPRRIHWAQTDRQAVIEIGQWWPRPRTQPSPGPSDPVLTQAWPQLTQAPVNDRLTVVNWTVIVMNCYCGRTILLVKTDSDGLTHYWPDLGNDPIVLLLLIDIEPRPYWGQWPGRTQWQPNCDNWWPRQLYWLLVTPDVVCYYWTPVHYWSWTVLTQPNYWPQPGQWPDPDDPVVVIVSQLTRTHCYWRTVKNDGQTQLTQTGQPAQAAQLTQPVTQWRTWRTLKPSDPVIDC